MSDLLGNHIVGFPTRRLTYVYTCICDSTNFFFFFFFFFAAQIDATMSGDSKLDQLGSNGQ